MNKIIYLLLVISVLLTGCGSQELGKPKDNYLDYNNYPTEEEKKKDAYVEEPSYPIVENKDDAYVEEPSYNILRNTENNYLFRDNVIISESDGLLTIKSNGLPDHETGEFPNKGNPNTITEQDDVYTMTLNPQLMSDVYYFELSVFGIGINGVTFEPQAAEWYNDDQNSGWQLDANSEFVNLGLDYNNAHVQPDGTYHYHGIPTELGNSLNEGLNLIGYAADGFPIYYDSSFSLKSSYQLKTGTRSNGPGGEYDGTYNQDYEFVENSGDLGECNSKYGETDEYLEGIWYYVITEKFPIVPRCFIGTPDTSFLSPNVAADFGGNSNKPSSQGPPQEAINACLNKNTGDSCSIGNNKEGECRNTREGIFACVPN